MLRLKPDALVECVFDPSVSMSIVTQQLNDKGFVGNSVDILANVVVPSATATKPAIVDQGDQDLEINHKKMDDDIFESIDNTDDIKSSELKTSNTHLSKVGMNIDIPGADKHQQTYQTPIPLPIATSHSVDSEMYMYAATTEGGEGEGELRGARDCGEKTPLMSSNESSEEIIYDDQEQ